MALIKNQSLKIIVITILSAIPCCLRSENYDEIVAYLTNLPKNSSSVASPLAGKVNNQFKPVQQQSPWAAALNKLSKPAPAAVPAMNTIPTQPQPTPQKSAKSQETKHTNGTKSIDYFDTFGKNISRIETDARGVTTSFINFYNDGTQSKTTYNGDGSQTISYFGTDRKNTSTTKLDKNGRTISITKLDPDSSAIETIYNLDGSQTIITFNTHGKSRSITEMNIHGALTERIDFSPDGSQTKTTHNQDGTKKIQILYSDKSHAITIYNLNGTQTTDHRDAQGKRIALTRVQANGTHVHASAQRIVAWHEAAHAISHTHNDTLSLINYITIKPQDIIGIDGTSRKAEGHVQASRRSTTTATIEDIDNKIMTSICGAVGEQLLMQDAMLNNPQEILELLAQPPYTDDMLQARHNAKEILAMNTSQNSSLQLDQKIDEILVRLYKQSYVFIAKHTAEVKKIADHLLEKETLNSDETYRLLNLKQPWSM